MTKFPVRLLVAFTVTVVMLAGCSEPTKPNINDASPPVSVAKTPTNFAIVAKPMWHDSIEAFYQGTEISGARYLDAGNPEVTAVKVLIQNYAKASFDIDYRRVNGREAVPFMTKTEVLIRTDGEGDGDQFIKDRDFWVKNRVVQEVTSMTVDGIMFSDDLTFAVVRYRVGETLESAAPAYLQEQTPVAYYSKDLRLKEGGTITRSYTAELAKEDGTWKVDANAEE
ncbi:MAG: hypothetical protein ACYC5Y_08405 [Symbiobacteriia bacterium]